MAKKIEKEKKEKKEQKEKVTETKKERKKGKTEKSGFTLVEIITAITIVVVLVLVAIPVVNHISEEITEKKYNTYKQKLESAGKTYLEKNKKEIFGSQTSGCYDITFDMLKKEKLIDDINVKKATCNDSRTIVRVHKNNDTYKYEIFMTCKKEEKITYPENGIAIAPAGVCDGKADTKGPDIKVSPNGSDKIAMKRFAKIYIEDVNGYGANQSFDYFWEKEGGGEFGRGTYEYKNSVISTSEQLISEKIYTPDNISGKYRLVLIPKNVSDTIGNVTTDRVYSKYYLLDNGKPSANIQIESVNSSYHDNKVRARVTSSDSLSGVTQVCLTTVNSISSCTWTKGTTIDKEYTFSTSPVGSGDTKTLYAYAKDKVGNVSIVAYQSYTIYENCTTSTYIDCSPLKKPGGGDYNHDTTECSAPDGTGWGKKKRSCSNRDSITGAYCSSVVRTCPCNSMCNVDGKKTKEVKPGCTNSFCEGQGEYCENNACRDESFY